MIWLKFSNFALPNEQFILREIAPKSQKNYDAGLVTMLKVCGSCQTRCGLHVGESYFEAEVKGSMDILSEWVRECDQVMTF
ncbi:hypothetical protein [Campylobacter concisus]|uniref:hypothetical protein n=1 Tax=Campylobacter concisus TaxID=199 RepID=UPI0021CC5284|nr:hypothetical protein [Campylobacter concisus]